MGALALLSLASTARATVIPHPQLSTAAQIVGTNAAQIDSNFQLNFAQAMTTYQAFNILNSLSNQEMYDVAQLYKQSPSITTTIFNTINAHNGRVAALVIEGRWKVAIAGTAALVPIPPTGGFPGALDFTLLETYYDFRLFGGPLGGPLSVSASIYSTAVFWGVNLAAAGTFGYAVGTGVAWLWQRVSPDSWEAFSNGVGTVVVDLQTLTDAALAADWAQIGAEELTMLNDFGTTAAEIGTGPGGAPGPFGVSQDVLCDSPDTTCE